MQILRKLSIAALLIGMQTPVLSSNNYEDLVTEGYRWVNIDGPYASKFEDDAQRLSENPTRDIKLQLLRAGSVYYLIEGSIVKVLRTDSTTGMAEIQPRRRSLCFDSGKGGTTPADRHNYHFFDMTATSTPRP